MRTDCLQALLRPRSVAVVGASQRPGKIGHEILKNLLSVEGHPECFAVNPHRDTILGLTCYATVNDLPHAPDLAIVILSVEHIPATLTALGQMGTRVALVLTSFRTLEEGSEAMHKQQILEASQAVGLRLVGPNSIGVVSPVNGLNASYSHLMPQSGKIAVISQSATMMTSIIDWAKGSGIGFSHLLSLGDMIDIEYSDVLDCMAADPNTQAILIYMESLLDARRFISAARAASRGKPVVVLKAGHTQEGSLAAATHTNSVTGLDAVYEAAFNRSGLVRVQNIRGLFHAAALLTSARSVTKERLAIITNGGSMGVLATDALIRAGGRLATLAEATLDRLQALLPDGWARDNPVDIIGDADPQRYAQVLETVMQDPGVGAVLVIKCPTAVTSGLASAKAVVEAAEGHKAFLLVNWVGKSTAAECEAVFSQHQIPHYETPEAAVAAFMHGVHYHRNQRLLMETPPTVPADLKFDTCLAWNLIEQVRADGRSWLTELESQELLKAYDIPLLPTRFAETPHKISLKASEIGFPVALKWSSPHVLHKSEIDGVVLNLSNGITVMQAANEMKRRAEQKYPDSPMNGFLVQKMVKRDQLEAVQISIFIDPVFGPVIAFGQGGEVSGVVEDVSLALPPLNMKLARDMVSRTRIFKVLNRPRNGESINLEALYLTLVKISQIVVDQDFIQQIDINPLLINEDGVRALSARVKIAPSPISGAERLAIHPYPSQFEEQVNLANGQRYTLRPIKPEDEPALIRNFEQLTPEQIRFRFFYLIKTMDHTMAARLSQIDYDREMAFVITQDEVAESGQTPQTQILGVVRLVSDVSGLGGEYALVVNHRVTGQGLGLLLMQRMIAFARSRNMQKIYGEVLNENKAMLALCRKLGFQLATNIEDRTVVNTILEL